jgi:hypothetical protein
MHFLLFLPCEQRRPAIQRIPGSVFAVRVRLNSCREGRRMKQRVLICRDNTREGAEVAGVEHRPPTRKVALGRACRQGQAARSLAGMTGPLPRRIGATPRWLASLTALALFGCGDSSDTQFVAADGSSSEICPAGQQQCGTAGTESCPDQRVRQAPGAGPAGGPCTHVGNRNSDARRGGGYR